MPEKVEPTEAPIIEPQQQTTQGEPVEEPLGEGGIKALKAERALRETAEAAVKEANAKLKAAEDAKLGDLERAQKEVTETREALTEVTKENIRNSVAITKGVPADLVEFLKGDSKEDVEKSADKLLAKLNVPTTPKPDLSQATLRDPAAAAGPEADFAQFMKSQLG